MSDCPWCAGEGEIAGIGQCHGCPSEPLPAWTTPERMREIVRGAYTPRYRNDWLTRPHAELNAALLEMHELQGVAMTTLASDLGVSPTRVRQRIEDARRNLLNRPRQK